MEGNVKRTLLLLNCLLVVFFFVSCGSTPKEEPVQPEAVAPVPEKKAEPVVTEKEPPKVDNTAKIKSLFQETDNARDLAMAAEAPSLLADEWSNIDKSYTLLKSNYTTEPSDEKVMNQIKNSRSLYKALEAAAKALAAKKRIEKLGFVQRDQTNYNNGVTALNDLQNLYDNNAAASDLLKTASSANDLLQSALYNSFRQLAKETRKKVIEKKAEADKINAGVAAKDDYKTAANILQEGDNQYVTKDPESAYKSYQKALVCFSDLYDSVSKKRAAAEKAIAAAKEKVQTTSDYATQADDVAPITDDSTVEGIEKDDTVLVQPETYDDPSSAVITVDSTIKEENEAQ